MAFYLLDVLYMYFQIIVFLKIILFTLLSKHD